ncbi:MAG: asparagine synthetase B [Phycisphaerae bacterium]|nr:asparagine synthetase B [Phycisphaerae bacterium]
MCGIAGFLDPNGTIREPESLLRSMALALVHRGPEDEGTSFDPASHLGFAFRRLAVQDLSATGHQPMRSPEGRYEVVFNGEVFNFLDLRRDVAPGLLRGTSDTEVMLALFDRYGVRATLDRLVGMFAMAIWDRSEGELLLVRDRLGVKPLYVGLTGEGPPPSDEPPDAVFDGELGQRALAFASELKALRPVPGMRFDIDRSALALFVRHSYVPAPWTIHPSIRKLPPGHLLRMRRGRCRLERYWSSKELVERRSPFRGTIGDATNEARRLIEQSVRERMIADVPVGAFLSGGIDSSLVVATMARVAPGRVRAFTIAMGGADRNEAERASEVARHLGVEHTVLGFSAEEALRLVPSMPDIWDEPFADSSQLATHLVARLARSHVTVALSGDGGDEVFGGYERYRHVPGLWELMRRMPQRFREPVANVVQALTPLLESIGGERVHKLAPILREHSAWAVYHRLTSVVADPGELLVEARERRVPLTDPAWLADGVPLIRRMMQADLVSYLPDDILAKVDRATMAVGLEAREPLLDHRLVEFTLGLPEEMLVGEGKTKPILRRLLAESLPPSLIKGPKRGFSVPLQEWLRGPLRPWAEALLDPSRLQQEGHFRVDAVRRLWEGVVRGEQLEHQAWNVLMFQAWLERWGHERD